MDYKFRHRAPVSTAILPSLRPQSSPVRLCVGTWAMAGEAASAADLPVGAAGGQREHLVFQTVDELCISLAKYTADLSEKCVREKGVFSVVLSGGYLIDCLWRLAGSPHAESVDWAKWHVFWVDERVVPRDHVESNYNLAYDGFLSQVPVPGEQVYGINDSLPAEDASDDYEACLKQLVETGVLKLSETTGFPIFDLMLLGMGPDGHIASLFPNHPLIKENTRWVTFIKDSPKPPPERITFTFPVINSSANIAMVVAGPGEAAAVSRALGPQDGGSTLLPVQMISLENGKLTWFTDKQAVSGSPRLPSGNWRGMARGKEKNGILQSRCQREEDNEDERHRLDPQVPLQAQLSRRRARALYPLAPLHRGDTCSMADEAASAAAAASPAGGQRELLVFQSVNDLCVSLARYTADLSDKCVREKGAFSVVLSGGYLIDCLRKLVESPYAESVDWAKWHVFWVDERAVRKDHVVNNYKLAHDGFLSKVQVPAEQVYGVNDSLPAEAAAEEYEACLKQLVKAGVLKLSAATGFPIFDLMLLGMGPDGHIASLFPNHPLIKENTQWVTFIKDSPKPPPQRITFTFPVINSSANIAMVVAGPGEAAAVSRALGDPHGSSNLLPVQMISLEHGKITWFADKEARQRCKRSDGIGYSRSPDHTRRILGTVFVSV
ncbi:hypothetical protein Taro_036879 [Colocasia esculenta]|uniref:6-phosphogluconolactonase n=1 Tax=Colocasia esculenta TaxID=4460 RepID=A0A843W829_COLES|nr:hypothetical protein [Colocasia esculenta]